jgi:hypothetical protein
MRPLTLAVVTVLMAVGTVVSIPHLPEDYVVALVVVPMVLCMLCGWVLLLQNRGMRVSRGWKELLLFGPLQAEPDNWGHRIARVPALALLGFIAIASGALLGILWTVLV